MHKTKKTRNRHKRQLIKKRKTCKKRKCKKQTMVGGATVTINNNPLLEKVNQINDQSIYKIHLNNCDYYINQKQCDYLLVNVGDNYELLKFDVNFPDINPSILSKIESIAASNKTNIFKMLNLRNYNVGFLYEKCFEFMDLTNAKRMVEMLNAKLKSKCSNLSLDISYLYDLHPPNQRVISFNNSPQNLILCLYNETGCISSISMTLEQDNSTMTISSKTESKFENRKYNKLLRCATILLMETLPQNITHVKSDAINPISAHLLVKYLGGIIPPDKEENEELYKYLKQNNIVLNENTNYKELFQTYQKRVGEDLLVSVYIQINDANVSNAKMKFDEVVNEIVC